MAGIGFSLRRLDQLPGLSGTVRLYAVAGMISSGPWLISIASILVISAISANFPVDRIPVTQFQVSVTYLFALSLILSGPLHLLFTRFVADRLFEEQPKVVLPNLFGAISLTTWVTGPVALLGALTLFGDQTLLYQLLMACGLVILTNLWVVVGLLNGLKEYLTVLVIFCVAYAVTIFSTIWLRQYGLEGLLSGFVMGQALLFFLSLALVAQNYPSHRLIAYDFLNRTMTFPILAFCGLLFNLSIWVDKFLFWFNPATSEAVIGPLRASNIYDIPIFLAYLTIVPGMTIFLVRVETEFVEQYDRFFDACREGAPLSTLDRLRDLMTFAARQGIFDICKVQGITLILVILIGKYLLQWLGVSPFYFSLLCIDTTSIGVQMLLLAILNFLYYLDDRRSVFGLMAFFFVSNTAATHFSLLLGPPFYGYGLLSSVSLTTLISLIVLNQRFDELVSETFVLQPVKE